MSQVLWFTDALHERPCRLLVPEVNTAKLKNPSVLLEVGGVGPVSSDICVTLERHKPNNTAANVEYGISAVLSRHE